MSDSEAIQQLIRLKRYEQPPGEFVEDFLHNFHDRQRSELLKQSARSLLWERMTTYFDDLMAPKWGWAFASAVALVSLGYAIKPANSGPNAQQYAANEKDAAAETFVVRSIVSSSALPQSSPDERNFISQHYRGGLADDGPRNYAQGAVQTAGLSLSDDTVLGPLVVVRH